MCNNGMLTYRSLHIVISCKKYKKYRISDSDRLIIDIYSVKVQLKHQTFCIFVIMQRGTRIDLDAAEFGFIENFKCSLTFKLQGECLAVNGSNEKYCQPLLGFGDDFKYFIISYLVEHSTNETKVYPEHGMNASLAEGDITSILSDYSGDEQGRDEQFYDAVTELGTNGSDAFTFFDGPRTENSWPIYLKVLRNETGVTLELGNGMGYWSTPFETNSSLHFGILDRLKRDDLGLDFGGFTISLITITRTCTATPAPPSANSLSIPSALRTSAMMF